jgi:predicted CoA-binding protein
MQMKCNKSCQTKMNSRKRHIDVVNFFSSFLEIKVSVTDLISVKRKALIYFFGVGNDTAFQIQEIVKA